MSNPIPLSVPAPRVPTVTPTPTPTSTLPHDRLDVYRLALEFHAVALALVPRRGCRALRDQLERASLSVVLNIAEGAGRNAWPDKRRFYEMAKGSAAECAAGLDVLSARRLADGARCLAARGLAVRLVQMLSRMSGPLR
jgi:four helix bundle protein